VIVGKLGRRRSRRGGRGRPRRGRMGLGEGWMRMRMRWMYEADGKEVVRGTITYGEVAVSYARIPLTPPCDDEDLRISNPRSGLNQALTRFGSTGCLEQYLHRWTDWPGVWPRSSIVRIPPSFRLLVSYWECIMRLMTTVPAAIVPTQPHVACTCSGLYMSKRGT